MSEKEKEIAQKKPKRCATRKCCKGKSKERKRINLEAQREVRKIMSLKQGKGRSMSEGPDTRLEENRRKQKERGR